MGGRSEGGKGGFVSQKGPDKIFPIVNFVFPNMVTLVWGVWGGGGGWHKALVVGSVSLWRRLLASRL